MDVKTKFEMFHERWLSPDKMPRSFFPKFLDPHPQEPTAKIEKTHMKSVKRLKKAKNHASTVNKYYIKRYTVVLLNLVSVFVYLTNFPDLRIGKFVDIFSTNTS